MIDRILDLDFYADLTNVQRVKRVRSPLRRKIERDTFDANTLDVYILNLDKPELVEKFIDGLSKAKATFEENELFLRAYVGDTGSSNRDTIRLLEEAPEFISTTWNNKYNFSRCNNDLFELGSGSYSLFLNNDVLINENPLALGKTLELFELNRNVGAVSAILNFEDGSLQHGGIDYIRDEHLRGFPYHPHAGKEWKHKIGNNFHALAGTGAFLMVRSELFAAVNGFNEDYEAECQDVELCLEFSRLGQQTMILDCGRLTHLENATRPTGEENWADRRLFMRTWTSYIEATQ